MLATHSNVKLLHAKLNSVCTQRKVAIDASCDPVKSVDVIAAVRFRIKDLAAQEEFEKLGIKVKEDYADVFSPLPHIDDMPDKITCKIELVDASKTIASRSYNCPRKFCSTWQTLIQQHLDAGRICPSSSPAFLIPKPDSVVLPRWVNNYRQLNMNIVTDRYPLHRIDDILADAGTRKIWSKLDMTDSFFHTKMHPDSIPLTAVNTPFGLYKWTVMPQGMKNSPSVHQHHVNEALHEFIRKFCHIYLDDIIIWSQLLEEHQEHVRLIMDTLKEDHLYCNSRKSEFFKYSICFLGHHISLNGIEPDNSKVKHILDWSVPCSPSEVRAFLGLVCYLASFLPNLADHTAVLSPLTSLKPHRFPVWTDEHQFAFNSIKRLVISADCLTVIDHVDPGDNKIFVTCDASDKRTSAVLSLGPTWETAQPVAYDSVQLKGAQLNYPVHEKELLSIVRACKKWQPDLLGEHFQVYTDHRTLENFETQKTLSRRQAHWLEELSQFDMTISYIHGEDNMVADALSCLPDDPLEEVEDFDPDEVPCWQAWLAKHPVASVQSTLEISADNRILDSIIEGYSNDEFCQKFVTGQKILPNVQEVNNLWYISDCLLIPHAGNIQEELFQLAHDCLSHFGSDKAYAALCDSYYWPNM